MRHLQMFVWFPSNEDVTFVLSAFQYAQAEAAVRVVELCWLKPRWPRLPCASAEMSDTLSDWKRKSHRNERGSTVKLYLFSSIVSSFSASACISPGRSEPPTRDCCSQVRMPSAQPSERSAGITWTRRFDSPLYLSRVSLRRSLTTVTPRVWSAPLFFFFQIIIIYYYYYPSKLITGSCLAVPVSPQKVLLASSWRRRRLQRSVAALWYRRPVCSPPVLPRLCRNFSISHFGLNHAGRLSICCRGF